MIPRPIPVVAVAAALIGGCGGDSTRASDAVGPLPESPTSSALSIDPGDLGRYTVTIDPARFESLVDNPYLPKRPGMRWEYLEITSDGAMETIVVEVLDERRVVMGVDTTVVHDVVTDAAGNIVEDTYDWFAQDVEGNVWYFGEDTTSYHDGAASHDGAWEAGVDGALPGIVMPAHPDPAEPGYRQEYLVGQAEDMGQVIATDATVDVPADSYTDVVLTRDWTPLEPSVVERKAYAPGIGWIHESKTDSDGTTTIAILTNASASSSPSPNPENELLTS